MASNNSQVSLPGAGGLMRYNEEYNSKLKFGPEMVIGMVVVTIVMVLGLRYFIG